MTAVAALSRAMFGAGFNPVLTRMQALKYAFLRDPGTFARHADSFDVKSSDFFGEFHTRNCANCTNQRRPDLVFVFKFNFGHATVIANR